MPKPRPDDLLTATQVGILIHRSGRTVNRAADADEIPIAARLPGPNGARLFRRDEAEKYAALVLAERAEQSA